MNRFTEKYSKAFSYLLPSPFSIALILTAITYVLALIFTDSDQENSLPHTIQLLNYWQNGLWNGDLLVFAMQMMLMLVLGHALALTSFFNKVIHYGLIGCKGTAKSAMIVALLSILVAYINWGLGLIFGAIFARKVADYNHSLNIRINFPLVGAAGYSGLMVWHGGISGSSLVKVAEKGHLESLVSGIMTKEQLALVPDQIGFAQTVFSPINLFVGSALLIVIPLIVYLTGKGLKPTAYISHSFEIAETTKKANLKGMERFDESKWISNLLGMILVGFAIYMIFSTDNWWQLGFISPNFINFTLLGCGILMHKNISSFLNAIEEAISGAAGILIQFPLYFGIMGIMKSSGLVELLSEFFVSISNEATFPIFTFISAGIVNVFIPSGGGQWAVQGPVIIQTAQELNIPLSKCIMAFAYGDQLTNMLQPFWALPLLGITGLKAKDILPYTLLLLLAGGAIFLVAILVF